MDILGWLKAIGGGVAAPFTGGATLPIALSGVSDILGGAAKSGQAQNNQSDQLKLLLENAKLNRDKFALAAPGTRLQTGMAAEASKAAPSTMNWGPNGFKPGAIAHGQAGMPTRQGGPETPLSSDAKQLSNTVLHDELISQLRGGTTGGGSRPGGDSSTTGTDSAMPTGIGQSSTSDKLLGAGAMGSSILALLAKLKGGGSSPQDTSGLFGDGTGDWQTTGVG